MALVGLPGSKLVLIGPAWLTSVPATISASAIDATNEAVIMIGHIETSDGGSHLIDTTGSSSIFWRTSSVIFANAGTTVKVGLAAVDTTNGPPGRAVNASGIISFDVSKTLIGGGGGITANAAQNHVPDSGSKTINNGDIVALCIQMTAKGGSDAVSVGMHSLSSTSMLMPLVTGFVGGIYNVQPAVPNAFITFSDGAAGWFFGGDVFSTINAGTWNSGGATKEYGQLYALPFPLKIHGLFGWISAVTNTSNFDLVLYSDARVSPVAEKTVSIDANTISIVTAGRRIEVLFDSPYITTADQEIAAVIKPGASNLTAFYKTLNAAAHRSSDSWGTSGYGISRASGAFADANSSLDHYYIGLIAGAFNEEASASIMGGSVIS